MIEIINDGAWNILDGRQFYFICENHATFVQFNTFLMNDKNLNRTFDRFLYSVSCFFW
jgi:hypothetical protein